MMFDALSDVRPEQLVHEITRDHHGGHLVDAFGAKTGVILDQSVALLRLVFAETQK